MIIWMNMDDNMDDNMDENVYENECFMCVYVQ